MKITAFVLSVFVAMTANTFAEAKTLSCTGINGNTGNGTLEINAKNLEFNGTQVIRSLPIDNKIECSGGRFSSKVNPSRYEAAGSCGKFTAALYYSDSKELVLVDDSSVSEPEVSAEYRCE